MGFGLFVPEFRSAFSMSTSTVGLVSSLGFLGFFLALLIARALLARWGPVVPVLCGLSSATLGMGLVAMATELPVLAVGVFFTASSAGLAWTPFNDVIHRKLREKDRPTALSMISTGTGIGIALAGLAALIMVIGGLSWRVAWVFFALASAAALVGNWLALHGIGKDHSGGSEKGWGDLDRTAVRPLLAIGFAYGTTSAIYISFAADHMVSVGGVPGVAASLTPPLVYIFYGLFGLTGLLTARIKALIGLPMLLRMLMLAGALSVTLVALTPDSWAGLVLSAGLQGVQVMMTSAALAFWSERRFPSLATLSFTVALLAAAAGSVAGPALAGAGADVFGAQTMFLGAAILPALTALMLRNHHAREQPV